jgi:kynureninase
VQSAFNLIQEAGISEIAKKAAIGTQLMIDLYESWLEPLGFELNTPRESNNRGGHISLVNPDAAQICVALRTLSKVIPDYRTPNSIRVAISPLATSYVELWDGFDRMRDLVASGAYKSVKESSSRVT